MQKKHLGLILLALLVVATLWFVVGGLSEDPVKPGTTAGGPGEVARDDEGGPGQVPVVKREEGLSGEQAAADAANLALPTALPALDVPAGTLSPAPTTPHGQFELEGEVQEADAEAAVRAMFPAIRDCYVELRKRAPQARGRMLMRFAVRPASEPGQASTGELFLKETQFTDPTYLTCVRAAIDSTKFPVRGNVNGSVTVPLFLAPQDAGEKAE